MPLAVGNHGGRAPHMAHDDDDQQREGNKRLRNERYEADNHGAARPLWPPRQADNSLPLGIGKRDDLVVSGRRRRVDQAEVLDVQMIGNLCQNRSLTYFTKATMGARAFAFAGFSCSPTATAATIAGRLRKF